MKTEYVNYLIEHLKNIMTSCGLELLQHHPKDLLVIDRATFERNWAPGQRFGWMAGHLHSHIAVLGLHPEENETVTNYMNLGSQDRFFEITVNHDGRTFEVAEVGRKGFEALQSVPVPYTAVGGHKEFSLVRAASRVMYVAIDVCGTYGEYVYKATITPTQGATSTDLAAALTWATHACRKLAGTLFYKSDYEVKEAIPDVRQAA